MKLIINGYKVEGSINQIKKILSTVVTLIVEPTKYKKHKKKKRYNDGKKRKSWSKEARAKASRRMRKLHKNNK